jgi:hypothetical protein
MTHKTEQDSSLFPALQRESSGGRPKIEPSERDRDKVRLLVAIGWTGEQIAAALGISRDRLYATFRTELAAARAMRLRLEAEILFVAAEQAIETGRPSSVRLFIELLAKHRAANHGADFGDPEPDTPAALGKKASERAAAEATMNADDDGEWGRDLDPSSFQ